MHGALDLVEELAEDLGAQLSPARLARIDIETFFMAATLRQQSVRTPFGCRFSIPIAVAQRITHGPVALTDDGARAFADPVVADLARRIFVSEDPAATAAYPDRQPTRIAVVFRDGQSRSASSERILGESDHPLPAGTLEAKFNALTDADWSGGAAAWRDLNRIQEIKDVRRLIEGWRTAWPNDLTVKEQRP